MSRHVITIAVIVALAGCTGAALPFSPASPTPTATPSATPMPTVDTWPSATPSPTPTATSSPAPTPTPSPTPTPTPTATPTERPNSGGGGGYNPPPSTPTATPVEPSIVEQSEDFAARFCRVEDDNLIYDSIAHDAMLVRGENGSLLMIAALDRFDNLQFALFEANASNLSDWEVVDDDYLPASNEYELDSIVKVEDRYLIYGDEHIWSTRDIRSDDWTAVASNPLEDAGAYYDGERVHLYYEVDVGSSTGGKSIAHSTSPNGVSNWTHHGTIFTAPDDWGLGDFEIITENGTVVILGDYTKGHPKYEQRAWISDNFYTNFSMLDPAVLEPRPDGDTYLDDYGVGDPTTVQLDDGRYLMIANGHPDTEDGPYLHYYVGSIGEGLDYDAICEQ